MEYFGHSSHSKCFCKKVDQLNFYRQFSATWQLAWFLISQKCLQGARTFSQSTLPPGHERLIIFIQIKLYYYLLSSRHLGVPIHWKNWGEDYAHHNTATPDFQTFRHPCTPFHVLVNTLNLLKQAGRMTTYLGGI